MIFNAIFFNKKKVSKCETGSYSAVLSYIEALSKRLNVYVPWSRLYFLMFNSFHENISGVSSWIKGK